MRATTPPHAWPGLVFGPHVQCRLEGLGPPRPDLHLRRRRLPGRRLNPFAPGSTISIGAGQIITGVLNIAGWAAQLGAMPLVLGALVVVPIWLVWRAILALFNKDRPPGPHDRILPKERAKRR